MPFKSKQQMKACFATKGFHGKIDCDEWAKDTHYKSLPNKKEEGGKIMYRPKKCKTCSGKMQGGGPLPSPGVPGTQMGVPVNRRPQTIEEANAYARNLALRTGLVSGENTHVGNTLPNYRDEAGNLLPDTWSPIPQSQVKSFIPSGVNELQWSSEANLPYYMDPSTGDITYTNRDNFYLPRFQKNRGQSAEQLGMTNRSVTPVPPTTVAMRMFGGSIQRRQMGGPLGPYTTADDPLVPGVNAPVDEYPVTAHTQTAMDPIQDLIAKGLLETPHGYDNPQQWYTAMNQQAPPQAPPTMRGNTLQNIGIAMGQGKGLLAEIAGRVERGRQNRYDYQQQSALGMQGAVQSSDFQPTPYSLYAKYGGSLRKYHHGGNKMMEPYHNLPIEQYNMMMEQMGYHMMPDGTWMSNDEMNSYKKGGWIQNAVNPEHKGYCTPMTKSTCTPRRKALAMTFKKHHGFHEEGGPVEEYQQGGRPVAKPDYSFMGPPTSKDSQAYRQHYYDYLNNKNSARDRWEAAFLINQKAIPPAMYDSIQNMYSAWSDAEDDMSNINDYDKSQAVNSVLSNTPGGNAARATIARMKAGMPPIKKQGGIHINPKNKGKFTEYCGGEVTSECIQRGLHSDSAVIRKRANFARNARKFNH